MTTEYFDPLAKLTKDLKNATLTLSTREVRYLVDIYYQMQDSRIRGANQVRSLTASEEPHTVVSWFQEQAEILENNVKRALQAYSQSQEIGQWLLSIVGIGPVISAGFLAHLDITKAPTVGHFWRFAGLDPTSKWLGNEGAKAVLRQALEPVADLPEDAETLERHENDVISLEEIDELTEYKDDLNNEIVVRVAAAAGRKPMNLLRLARDPETKKLTKASLLKALARRPWNARLKVICWKASESFVKTCNNDKSYYGPIYLARKQWEQEQNEAGNFAEQAKKALSAKNYDKKTDAYKAYILGKLPPAHIQARSTRYTVKIFLAHLHEVMYRRHYGSEPPRPYAIEHMGHAHYIAPPGGGEPAAEAPNGD